MPGWWKETGLEKGILGLSKSNPYSCWGLDTGLHGHAAILGGSRGHSTTEDEAHTHINILSSYRWHVSALPSWVWARWWAMHAIQVMHCMGTVPVGFLVQLGSGRDGSGPVGYKLCPMGISLVLKATN